MSNQLQITGGAKVRNLNGVITGTTGVLGSVPLGAANGVATLDSGGKVPVSQLPSSVVTYLGTWNAATNTPTLVNGTGDAGDMYICNVAGTVNFGAGPVTFAVGDWVLYGSGTWQKSNGQNGTVTSVAVTETGDALTITGSPITTAGTINIGFAGTSAQYVAGDGTLITFPSLTGYVPYTGANANVDLGTYGLLTDFVGLNTSPSSIPTSVGTMSWDSFYKTPQVVTGTGNTTLQIGQEEVILIHNGTGATLTDGQVVYITGSTGELPSVSLASNADESTSAATLGVVTETIANGSNGFVTVSGVVHGLNTLAYNEGDLLWLGTTAGTFTTTKPVSPNHLVLIGYVVKKAGGNGSILVKIQNTQELEECSDVLFTSLTNNDIMYWQSSSSLWKNASIPTVLGYTPANDSLVVKLAGTQTITGTKTFTATTTASKIRVDNTLLSEGTTVAFKQYESGTLGETGYTSLAAQGSNLFYINWGGTKAAILDSVNLSTFRTYTLPNADGTIALTSDIPSLSATAPISYSGGVISISQATTSTNGYLSSTDWNTFNGKLSATGIIPNGTLLKYQTSTGTLVASDITNGTSGFVAVNGSLYANTFIRDGGTSSQFLKADGSVDSNTYLTTSSAASTYLPLSGGTLTGALSGTTATFSGIINANAIAGASNGSINIDSTDPTLRFRVSGGTANKRIYEWRAIAAGGAYDYLQLRLWNDAQNSATELLGIASTGAATFSRNDAANVSVTIANAYLNQGNLINFQQNKAGSTINAYIGHGGDNTGNFIINNGGGERMTITPAGNVGIGTSSPNLTSTNRTTVDINGANQSLLVFSNAGTYKGYIYNGGTDMDYTAVNQALFGAGTNVIINTAGSERMRITSGGNVGIGTSSPATPLDIRAAIGSSGMITLVNTSGYSNSNTIDIGFTLANSNTGLGTAAIIGVTNPSATGNNYGDIYFKTSYASTTTSERMRITSGGNVGIGTSSPTAVLSIQNSTTPNIDFYTGIYKRATITGDSASLTLGALTGSPIIFTLDSTERMRITSSGAVGIGTSTPLSGYRTTLVGTGGGIAALTTSGGDASFYSSSTSIGWHIFADNGVSSTFYVLRNGDVRNANNSYGAISDISLKENIVDASPKLDDLLKVKIRNYNLIADETKTKQIGVIAQELEEIFPNMISEDKQMGTDKTIKTVKYSVFVPMLIKAIQEQQQQIEELKAKIK